jgi:hypothetical protein
MVCVGCTDTRPNPWGEEHHPPPPRQPRRRRNAFMLPPPRLLRQGAVVPGFSDGKSQQLWGHLLHDVISTKDSTHVVIRLQILWCQMLLSHHCTVSWYFTDEEVDEWEEEDEPPDEHLPDEVLQRYTGRHFIQRLALSLPLIQVSN